MNQTIVLDPVPRLLIGDPDTRVTAAVRKAWWRDRVDMELRAA